MFPILTKKQLYRKFDGALNQVKHGVYCRLFTAYQTRMNREKAGLLAAAVTNRLFSLPPSSEDGRKFLDENGEKVEKAVADLKGDADILHAVTIALRVRQRVLFDLMDQGKLSGNAINKPVDRLMKEGLLAPVKEVPDMRGFIRFAKKFFTASPR